MQEWRWKNVYIRRISWDIKDSLVLLKIYKYFKNMVEESISQEFRFKSVDGTRNYFLEEIEQNELMSRKHK